MFLVVTRATTAHTCAYACGTYYKIPYAKKFIQSQCATLKSKLYELCSSISTVKYNSIFFSSSPISLANCGRFHLNGLAYFFFISIFFFFLFIIKFIVIITSHNVTIIIHYFLCRFLPVVLLVLFMFLCFSFFILSCLHPCLLLPLL